MITKITNLFFILLLTIFVQLTYAQTDCFDITLDGMQANAGNGTGSAGLGSGTATYDSGTMMLTISGNFSGLTGTTTAAHIHSAPAGSNGGVVFGLTFSSGVTSGTFSGSGTLTAAQEATLLADGFYVNIHTSAFGGGEIRGQLLIKNPLPVELTNFNLVEISNKTIAVKWETLSETNSDYFLVERSIGEDDNYFESIGQMMAAGNSSDLNRYTFIDDNVISGKTNYYRLKQVDRDGQFDYSPIQAISIIALQNTDVRIFPSIVNENQPITLELVTESSLNTTFNIINTNGQLVYSANLDIEEGLNKLEVLLPTLESGTYFLRIKERTLEVMERFVVLK